MPMLVEIRIDGILALVNLGKEEETVMVSDFSNFISRTIQL